MASEQIAGIFIAISMFLFIVFRFLFICAVYLNCEARKVSNPNRYLGGAIFFPLLPVWFACSGKKMSKRIRTIRKAFFRFLPR